MKKLLTLLPLTLLVCPPGALALDRLCDSRHEDCRAPLINLIRNETQRIDVAFWFMEDGRYANELIARHKAGVPIRVLVDPRADDTKRLNQQIRDQLAAAGIPLRKRAKLDWGDILHWKVMLFPGQNVVEFSAANYTPSSFVANTPYKDYIDEVIYFTDDPRIVNTFKTKFENLWTNQTGKVVDYANITSPPTRVYGVFTQDPALNFPPTQDYAARAISHYNREPQGGRIDVTMYRISDGRHADAMIAAKKRGIPIRLITEQENYRDTRYIWHSYNVDRMYAAGIAVKDRNHLGLMHQKSVVLHGQREVIWGSSNWSTASSNEQEEHNLFSLPCQAGATTWCDPGFFFQYFVDQFNSKWASNEFKAFTPLPPGTPVNYSPANGAVGTGTTVTLTWDGGNWAHKYDIYIGVDPGSLSLKASNVMVGSPYTGQKESWKIPYDLVPGRTYYWRIVSKTMANKAAGGPTWSFTVKGTGATPSMPSGLRATTTAPLQITLTWSGVSGATQYVVERSLSATSGFNQIAIVSGGTTRYVDSGLVAGRKYYYRVRAGNSNGYSSYTGAVSATASASSTLASTDVVLYAGKAGTVAGNWAAVADANAAGGKRMHNKNLGLAKVAAAAASPKDYFQMTFNAQAGKPYNIWIRGHADSNSYQNDSVWVQFSGTVNASGTAIYRIGTTSGMAISIEECSGCGLAGYGWHDSGSGVGVRGKPVYFAKSGTQTIRVQRREDGISIDQIVISTSTYLKTPPGAAKNDKTILPQASGASATATTTASLDPGASGWRQDRIAPADVAVNRSRRWLST